MAFVISISKCDELAHHDTSCRGNQATPARNKTGANLHSPLSKHKSYGSLLQQCHPSYLTAGGINKAVEIHA